MKTSFRRSLYNVFFRLSPLLILVLLELSLRFLGLGESYTLFRESGDGSHYELNPAYYRRFVSAEQFPDVKVLDQRFPVEKPAGSKRVFLIGDQSFCMLFPEANREQVLRDFYGPDSTRYDIVQIAVPLSNSFALTHIVKKLAFYDADACIVLSGAAEFYGLPQKSGWVRDIDNYWGLRAYVTLKAHRFLQVLDRFVYLKKDGNTRFPPRNIDEWIISGGSPAYEQVLSYYARNLSSMARLAEFPLYFVNPPVNLNRRPYRSDFNDKEMKDEELARECAILVDNADRFSIDRWIGELQAWEPETAIYYYCRAMINERRGEAPEAVGNYEKALALDVFRVRPQPDAAELIREMTAGEAASLIDVQEAMKAHSAEGLNIDRYFRDGLSLNGDGKEIVLSMLRSALTEQ